MRAPAHDERLSTASAIKSGIVAGLVERATELGRNACQAADVQWLDQSVHALGLRLCRLPNGWLGFERTFRFDYSHDGIERHSGRMVLRGRELVSFIGPASAARVNALRQNNEDAEDV